MDYCWLIVILVLSIIELGTVSLVTVWFIASALVALVLSCFGIDFTIQFGTFVILGTVLLITTRKSLVKMLDKTRVKTNFDRILDMEGLVTEDITKNNSGEVKVDGKRWTAISSKDIKKGSTVKIKKIDGVKLIVEEV